jgi:hypothetical protein
MLVSFDALVKTDRRAVFGAANAVQANRFRSHNQPATSITWKSIIVQIARSLFTLSTRDQHAQRASFATARGGSALRRSHFARPVPGSERRDAPQLSLQPKFSRFAAGFDAAFGFGRGWGTFRVSNAA